MSIKINSRTLRHFDILSACLAQGERKGQFGYNNRIIQPAIRSIINARRPSSPAFLPVRLPEPRIRPFYPPSPPPSLNLVKAGLSAAASKNRPSAVAKWREQESPGSVGIVGVLEGLPATGDSRLAGERHYRVIVNGCVITLRSGNSARRR
jgi:hypothetical protein